MVVMNREESWKKNLIPIERHPRPYTEDKFRELYYSGMTITEISDHFSIGRKKIQTDMKRFNVVARTAAKRDQSGEKNTNWKGEDVGYVGSHIRKRKLHGHPKKCEVCGTNDIKKSYEWANLTGNFSDPNDYKRMCRSCHSKYDKIERNFDGKGIKC